MSKPKLTGWYPPNIPPVYVGPYERRLDNGNVYFSWWVGAFFGYIGKTAEEASKYAYTRSPYQNLPWRGLTEPSK